MLADLEGKGITECLSICSDEELKAEIIKIPHHGAWKETGGEFEKLLDKIDPILAVLSVGSNNKYGHVKPDLFSELLKRKNGSVSQFMIVVVNI